MPYIKKEDRPAIDALIEPLISQLESLPQDEQDGALNYVVTKILRKLYPQKYFHLNRALGVLEAIKAEFYRRVVGPHEDQAIQENGDIN
ncbi:hypothetical protein HY389_00935 [Candidatus Daviesbacteria bacterium]|nr:hypothetical protein [Candidatus Daviesbacteria bacterium]